MTDQYWTKQKPKIEELKPFDDNLTGNEKEDEYETPPELYFDLCMTYQLKPELDVAANQENSKCKFFLTDGLHKEWMKPHSYKLRTNTKFKGVDVWCNPPHSLTEQFVKRANQQAIKHNINILMIVPANSICAKYWDEILESPFVEYFRISGRITFYRNRKPSKFPSRNGYFVIIWRKV